MVAAAASSGRKRAVQVEEYGVCRYPRATVAVEGRTGQRMPVSLPERILNIMIQTWFEGIFGIKNNSQNIIAEY